MIFWDLNKPRQLRALILTLIISMVMMNSIVHAKETSVTLIDWSSEEGIERFQRANKVDFFKLANFFEAQNNKIYCGVASSVIVLNALRVRNGEHQARKPLADSVLSEDDRKYIPKPFTPFFDRYTQDNVFTSNAKGKLEILGKPYKLEGSDKEAKDGGLQLAQLQGLLQGHELKVIKKVAGETHKVDEFRKDVMTNLKTKDDYILVNYTRKVLNQPGGGHISPVGAYDELTDSVLVMDVNSNKADWVWVSVPLLYDAMNTFDILENRGYLLISEN